METLGILWALARMAFLIRLAETRAAWDDTYQKCAGRYRIRMHPWSRAYIRWAYCRVRRFVRTPTLPMRHATLDDSPVDDQPCGCGGEK